MILFIALIGLVIFSFIAIFIGFSNLIMVILSGIGVIIFYYLQFMMLIELLKMV